VYGMYRLVLICILHMRLMPSVGGIEANFCATTQVYHEGGDVAAKFVSNLEAPGAACITWCLQNYQAANFWQFIHHYNATYMQCKCKLEEQIYAETAVTSSSELVEAGKLKPLAANSSMSECQTIISIDVPGFFRHYSGNSVESCYKGIGKDYRGKMSTTKGGRTCQRWDSQSPNKHTYRADKFPDHSLADAGNYCRNPSNNKGGLWCYTTDKHKRWEHCNVSICEECYETTAKAYRGKWSKTKSGKTCQRWDNRIGHHRFGASEIASNFPDASLHAANNYCRSPDGKDAPWCYLDSHMNEFEYCKIKKCKSDDKYSHPCLFTNCPSQSRCVLYGNTPKCVCLDGFTDDWYGIGCRRKTYLEKHKRCPHGFDNYKGGCYRYSGSDYAVQKKAITICASLSTSEYRVHLLKVETFQKYNHIQSWLTANHWSNVLLGLRKVGGRWQWYDGTPLTWSDWHNTHESSGDAGFCAYMHGHNKWRGDHCTTTRRYICEVK